MICYGMGIPQYRSQEEVIKPEAFNSSVSGLVQYVQHRLSDGASWIS